MMLSSTPAAPPGGVRKQDKPLRHAEEVAVVSHRFTMEFERHDREPKDGDVEDRGERRGEGGGSSYGGAGAFEKSQVLGGTSTVPSPVALSRPHHPSPPSPPRPQGLLLPTSRPTTSSHSSTAHVFATTLASTHHSTRQTHTSETSSSSGPERIAEVKHRIRAAMHRIELHNSAQQSSGARREEGSGSESVSTSTSSIAQHPSTLHSSSVPPLLSPVAHVTLTRHVPGSKRGSEVFEEGKKDVVEEEEESEEEVVKMKKRWGVVEEEEEVGEEGEGGKREEGGDEGSAAIMNAKLPPKLYGRREEDEEEEEGGGEGGEEEESEEEGEEREEGEGVSKLDEALISAQRQLRPRRELRSFEPGTRIPQPLSPASASTTSPLSTPPRRQRIPIPTPQSRPPQTLPSLSPGGEDDEYKGVDGTPSPGPRHASRWRGMASGLKAPPKLG